MPGLLTHLLRSIHGGSLYERQCINVCVEWGLVVLVPSPGLLLAGAGDVTRAGTVLARPARY